MIAVLRCLPRALAARASNLPRALAAPTPSGRRGPRTAGAHGLVGACLLALLLAACAAPSASGPQPGELPVIRSYSDISLPLDEFVGTWQERATMQTARDELVARCMASKGYPGYPVGNYSGLLVKPMHENRFGLVDEAEASRQGFIPGWVDEYTNAGAMVDIALGAWDSPEVQLALTGSATSGPLVGAPGRGTGDPGRPGSDAAGDGEGRGGDEAPDPSSSIESYDAALGLADQGGCKGQARKELLALGGREEHDRSWITFSAERQIVLAEEDPRMKPVAAAWTECMQQAGYPYQERMDAALDRLWAQHPPEEKTAAVASVRCTQSSRYVDTLVMLAREYQQQFIEKNAERLAEEREFKKAALAAIAEQGLGRIGGTTGGPPPGGTS